VRGQSADRSVRKNRRANFAFLHGLRLAVFRLRRSQGEFDFSGGFRIGIQHRAGADVVADAENYWNPRKIFWKAMKFPT
jgi:hypothetical protein